MACSSNWPVRKAGILARSSNAASRMFSNGGGMRRTWLRGRENVHKRYLVHVAGYNLGVLMRALFGAGTPREAAAAWNAFVFVIQAAQAIVVVVVAACDVQIAALVIAVAPDPT